MATCALLLEVAHVDEEFSDQERQTIGDLVRQRFGLTKREADDLISLAESERRQSTDLYQFTRLISEQYPRQEKLAVLQQLQG